MYLIWNGNVSVLAHTYTRTNA